MSKPKRFKNRFRVKVTFEGEFYVWADSQHQVYAALEGANEDLIELATDANVFVSTIAHKPPIDQAVVLYSEDSNPEWVHLLDAPWIPVDNRSEADPECDEDGRPFLPLAEELEKIGQQRIKEL